MLLNLFSVKYRLNNDTRIYNMAPVFIAPIIDETASEPIAISVAIPTGVLPAKSTPASRSAPPIRVDMLSSSEKLVVWPVSAPIMAGLSLD